MAIGKVAADSSVVVTHKVGGTPLIESATAVLGSRPVVWGRYFTGKGTKNSVVYRPEIENAPLHEAGIRLLPIARQTKLVGGSQADGTTHGAMNAEAFISAFGADIIAAQGAEFLMFLDIEGPPHSLSASYYAGWSAALMTTSRHLSSDRFTLLPAIYATQADDVTWRVVRTDGGAKCFAAWVARWRVRGCSQPLDFRPDIVQPKVKIGCPVVLWQYADECHGGDGFDCDELNPDAEIEKSLLSRLILPPAMATGAEAD